MSPAAPRAAPPRAAPSSAAPPRAGPLLAMAWKDAAVAWRGRHALQAGLVVVLLFLVVDLLAFPSLRGERHAAAAALWVPLAFATAALTGRHLAVEADRGTLALLRSAPVPALAIGASRTGVDLVLALLVAAVTAGGVSLLFGVALAPAALAALGLGALGLTVLGSLTGAIAAQANARETLLPILLVPVATPLLQAGLAATAAGLQGAGVAEASGPLLAMSGYILLAAAAATVLWPVLLEE